MLIKFFFLFIIFCYLNLFLCNEEERRHKEIDSTYTRLIPFSEVPFECESTTNGYAIVENGLEKCEFYSKEDISLQDKFDTYYEKYKCKNLRLNGELNEHNICQCKKLWKGPLCNEFIGCPEGHSYFDAVCTPNICQHDGKLAISTTRIECICRAPWDGRFCTRLACWRMASKEHETRWRNKNDHCICADGYDGENCDKILFCKNGKLVNGRCQCEKGFKGELCDKNCTPNQTCGTSGLFTLKKANYQIIIYLSIICLCLFWF